MIETHNLSKDYKSVKAASNINLHVKKGEIYGFLGLNGAGKTTVIRMLLGLISPTSGSCYIDGYKVHANQNELWNKIGYLVEVPYSYGNLTVRENLEIVRKMRFIKERSAVDRIMEELELSRYAHRKASQLSLGNSQRLGLARALIHHPELLILDEPTNGLDPAGIYDVRRMLINLAEEHGVTIFISSHILGEISRFCTRIGIIHEGEMVEEINTNQLNQLCNRHLKVNTRDQDKAVSIIGKLGFKQHLIEDSIIYIKDRRAIENADMVASELVKAGYPPTHLSVEEENLESFFLRTIKKQEV